MKILILVLSFNDDNGIYSKFYETQKNTWDSETVDDIKTYYFFGNHTKNEIIENNIFLNIPENGVKNCGYKTLETFKIIQDFDYDFIFRTNSSSYVDKVLLKNFLKNKTNKNHYSGAIGIHGGIKFASGSGFFLSKDLVKKIIENSYLWNHNLIDDVAIGDILSKNNIYPSTNDRFDVYNNKNIPMNYFHYRLKTENRYFDIENMKIIHNLKKK